MRRTDIELRATSVLDARIKGLHVEDNFVELKGLPPSPEKKARQIAGSANAAHGETVIWIFGAADDGTYPDISDFDFDRWFADVRSQFDGPYPEPTTAWMNFDGNALLAVAFRTDQAPYVINEKNSPESDRDVPWREGSRTRSAKRAELLRLISARIQIPLLDILFAQIALQHVAGTPVAEGRFNVSVIAEIFVEPRTRDLLSLASHRCSLEAQVGGKTYTCELGRASLRSTSPELQFGARQIPAGVLFDAPGTIQINTPTLGEFRDSDPAQKEAGLSIVLGFGEPVGSCEARLTLPRTGTERFLVRNLKVELVELGSHR